MNLKYDVYSLKDNYIKSCIGTYKLSHIRFWFFKKKVKAVRVFELTLSLSKSVKLNTPFKMIKKLNRQR